MSNYRRLISYMYAYEGQVKGKNVGFAKLEVRNGQCKIQVSVKKVYESGNDVGVYLLADEMEILIGKIYIRNGNGEFRTSVRADNVELSGFSMAQVYGLTLHDIKNPWVSYTTIWEDAVTQAAQIDLEYVTSEKYKSEELQEEREMQIVQQIEEEVERQEREKEMVQEEERRREERQKEERQKEDVQKGEIKREKNFQEEEIQEEKFQKDEKKSFTQNVQNRVSWNENLDRNPTDKTENEIRNEIRNMVRDERKDEISLPSTYHSVSNNGIGEEETADGSTQEKETIQLYNVGYEARKDRTGRTERTYNTRKGYTARMESEDTGVGYKIRTGKENIREEGRSRAGTEDKNNGMGKRKRWECESQFIRQRMAEPSEYWEESFRTSGEMEDKRESWTPYAAELTQRNVGQNTGTEKRENKKWFTERIVRPAEYTETGVENITKWNSTEQSTAGGSNTEWNTAERNIAEWNAAKSNNAERNITEWSNTEWNAAERSIAEQNAAERNAAEQNIAEQNSAGKDTKHSSWFSLSFSGTKQTDGDERAGEQSVAAGSGNKESRLPGWTAGIFNRRKAEEAKSSEKFSEEKKTQPPSGMDLARQITFHLFEEKPAEKMDALQPGEVWNSEKRMGVEKEREKEQERNNRNNNFDRREMEAENGRWKEVPYIEGREPGPNDVLEPVTEKIFSSKMLSQKAAQFMAKNDMQNYEMQAASENRIPAGNITGTVPVDNEPAKCEICENSVKEGSEIQNKPVSSRIDFKQDAEKLREFEQEEQSKPEDSEKLWESLRSLYPKLQEFDYETGCEILAIKPKDIGLLPRENWVYGNNSFLLHGYYNYRYLILVQLTEAEGKRRYLLGVPGHYYNNDKYMASMFGFPGFVLSKKQPTEDGRFGYWYTNITMQTEE